MCPHLCVFFLVFPFNAHTHTQKELMDLYKREHKRLDTENEKDKKPEESTKKAEEPKKAEEKKEVEAKEKEKRQKR